MRRVSIPVVGDSYSDQVEAWAGEETINWVPEASERQGTRTPSMLKTPDGLLLLGTVGVGQVRGAITMDAVLYVVADTTLYSVSATGVGTSLGTIEGSGLVRMSENGYQVTVVNGLKGWTYNATTLAFAQITDPDFSPSVDCCFIGTYTAHVKADSDEWFISAIADSTSYNALDYASKESDTGLIKGIEALNSTVWLFGSKNGSEVWQNTGAPDFPFERIATINRGIASTHAKAKLDNSIFWLGEDGIAYRADGYTPKRISTRPIEQAIAKEDLSEAYAFGYEKGGHAFFVLGFITGKTFVYDAASGLWHRRKSFELERWRANCYAFAYGKHLVGDFTNGKLWELDSETYAEGDEALISERKTQYLSDDGNVHRMVELNLRFNTGVGLTTGQGSDPIVELAYVDEGAPIFGDFREESLGAIGQYGQRVAFHGLGAASQRRFWIRVSDPVRRDLLGAEAVIP